MNLEKVKEIILSENESPWNHPNKLTMLPKKTLENFESCIRECIDKGIEGDIIECGVWRGGSVIFANEVLKSLNRTDIKIYVADSFEGLPKPNPEKYPHDKDDKHYTMEELKISLDEVKNNFKKFGEITDNVVFLKGWFKDTLPTPEIKKLSVLRMDGDMYESTMDILVNLYHKLSVGGFCIIDDFGHMTCRKAVEDFREQKNIKDKITIIDDRPNVYPSAYWIKS
jgi:O-methyltransferase